MIRVFRKESYIKISSMASYSTTAALLTNLWMERWIISYPFASVPKTTVPSLSSIIGVVCGCAGGTNCRTLISKSPNLQCLGTP